MPQIAFALGLSTDEYVAPRNNVFYLRYALDDSKANDEERFDALRLSLTWRANEGLSIVTSARQAVNSAMAGKTWKGVGGRIDAMVAREGRGWVEQLPSVHREEVKIHL